MKFSKFLIIHITFSIAPVIMKIPLSLFIFIYRKYIYFKRRLNFLSNHGSHKNKNKRFSRKKLPNTFMGVEV